MRKKMALLMSLVTLLFFSTSILRVGAIDDLPVVSVDPGNVTVPTPGIGLTFTVNITISNVTLLYGYEFRIYWNNQLLNCTSVIETPPAEWADNWFAAGDGVVQDYNATHGVYDKAVAALSPAPPFNGSVVVVTLNFTALTLGGPSLISLGLPFPTYPAVESNGYTKLASAPSAEPIVHTSNSGNVTVEPEFPNAIVLPLFLIAALVAVIVGKVAWTRRRRVPFVAK